VRQEEGAAAAAARRGRAEEGRGRTRKAWVMVLVRVRVRRSRPKTDREEEEEKGEERRGIMVVVLFACVRGCLFGKRAPLAAASCCLSFGDDDLGLRTSSFSGTRRHETSTRARQQEEEAWEPVNVGLW